MWDQEAADGGDPQCNICTREFKSGGKGGGTTNLRNNLTRNHASNKEVIAFIGANQNIIENKALNLEQPKNSSLIVSPSTSSMSMDFTETISSSPSPVPSLPDSENRLSNIERQFVLQPFAAKDRQQFSKYKCFCRKFALPNSRQ